MSKQINAKSEYLRRSLWLLVMLPNMAFAQGELMLTSNIDIPKFMGKWYVIANIPTPFERNVFNAVEEYSLVGPNKVQTTFSYNKGSADGPLSVAKPMGFISAENPAVWKMQFLWPFKADYRVMFVDDSHSVTIIGREKRDYVWLMSREPIMDDQRFTYFASQIEAQGYDISKLQKIPQTQTLVAQQPAG